MSLLGFPHGKFATAMTKPYLYCPQCGGPLVRQTLGQAPRQACVDAACGFVHWDNPVPVVAAVVEHEGRIILARNTLWPVPFYALITGFLEKTDASPDEAVQREVQEELGLQPLGAHFIGHYPFARQNQIILAYHVPAQGRVVLNEELSDHKHVEFEQARYWPSSTGFALRDWLRSRGLDPQPTELPKLTG